MRYDYHRTLPDQSFGARVSDYRRDPFFPTRLPLAVVLAARDMVSARLNQSLLGGDPAPRPLTRLERLLLWLGF